MQTDEEESYTYSTVTKFYLCLGADVESEVIESAVVDVFDLEESQASHSWCLVSSRLMEVCEDGVLELC